MSGTEYLIGTNILSFMAIASLALILISKMNRIKDLRAAIFNLKKALDEMDEQAKLIVRTDMELNKTQERLDKKITGLYVLQRLSRAISTTLQEEQIFKRIGSTDIEELGFEKSCVFLWKEKEKKFYLKLNIGYLNNEIKNIQNYIEAEKQTYLNFINTGETISCISTEPFKKNPDDNELLKEEIKKIFKSPLFVLSPISLKEGEKGFLFVGTDGMESLTAEGDEELITVLANQIGQALENARLFEETWRAQQELEKKVEERTHALTVALDEVKKINRRKTDFVSSVTHELRTPLTSIKGYASILLTGKLGALPQEAYGRIEKINRHSDELARLVNELLDIARIESGKVVMKNETVNLKGIAQKVSELLSPQFKEHNLELFIDIAEDATDIIADSGQIERVFINLLGNAIKFTPAGGKIYIKSRKTDTGTRIDVIDTGCGIPKEAHEAVFDEFYRMESTINQGIKGTGLGLSLVKNIIDAHKGKIWVESETGKGSTFSFILPK